MSSAPSYSNVLAAYSTAPVFTSAFLNFVFNNANIYAVDFYGNLVQPSTTFSSFVQLPNATSSFFMKQITFNAAFSYPYINFYLVIPNVYYPMVISFDYPVKFITINMSVDIG